MCTCDAATRRNLADAHWARIEQELQSAADATGAIRWDVSAASTTARAHMRAAGARHASGARHADQPGDHVRGRSRGG